MRTPRLPDALRPIVVVLAGAAIIFLVTAAGSTPHTVLAQQRGPESWRGLVGDSRPPAELGSRMIVLLKAPSLAQQLAAAGGTATEPQERAWTAAALATQAHLLAFLTANGIFVQPEFRYARVLNGFAATLDSRAVGLIERSSDVLGVYPVRAAYPTSVPSLLSGARRRQWGDLRRAGIDDGARAQRPPRARACP